MSSLTGSRGPTGGGVAGYRTGSIQNYTPDQMSLFKSLFSNVSPDSQLSKLAGGDQSTFQQMEAPAMRQFQELMGNQASRFSGAGMGSRRSSSFQNANTAATSNFAQDLQSRRQDLQRQALRDLMSMSGELLGAQPYKQFQYEPQQPMWQKLLGGALPIAGSAIGGAFGGPAGAAIGGRIGSSASKAFF